MRARSGKTGNQFLRRRRGRCLRRRRIQLVRRRFSRFFPCQIFGHGRKTSFRFCGGLFCRRGKFGAGKALFEILSLDIRRASKSVGEECAAIAELLERSGVAKGGVSRWFSSKGANGYQRKFLKSLADKIGASFTNPPSKYGDNYCLSASVFCECAGRTGDICLQYTLSSTSMRAVTLFKVQ